MRMYPTTDALKHDETTYKIDLLLGLGSTKVPEQGLKEATSKLFSGSFFPFMIQQRQDIVRHVSLLPIGPDRAIEEL